MILAPSFTKFTLIQKGLRKKMNHILSQFSKGGATGWSGADMSDMSTPLSGVYKTKTEDRRPKIENEDEDAYNHNPIQSSFLTSSANRPFYGYLFDEQS